MKPYQKWRQTQDENFTKEADNRLQELYKEFIAARQEGQLLTREQKLSLMRDTLTVAKNLEEGEAKESFTSTGTLPAFYAQDLIMFGIKKDFPEAVRIGESILVRSDAKMPRDLTMAVKNYMLKSSDKYYAPETMARTGLIDTSRLYRTTKDEKEQSLFCMDDPYWQNQFKKNYKREDQHKLPQIYSWNHKKHDLMGEIFDMDDLERKKQ